MYSVKLADDTVLDNLELNGNNFISDTIISDEVFKDNLSTVVVTNEDGSTEHTDMKLIQNKVLGNKSWFILAEKTKEELEKEKFNQLLADLTELVLLGGMQYDRS